MLILPEKWALVKDFVNECGFAMIYVRYNGYISDIHVVFWKRAQKYENKADPRLNLSKLIFFSYVKLAQSD